MRHELHLARAGFAALAAVAAVGAVVGGLFDGSTGALSALLGTAIVAGNHGVAVLSTGWSRALTPGVLAVGYAVFAFRMLIVLALFATLSSVVWVNGLLLAAFFCAALVFSLGAECYSFARGSYVPAWMRRTALLPNGRTR